jgi:hypothetical protein
MYKRGCMYVETKLTTHLHLVPRLRMSGAIPLLPPVSLHGMDRKTLPFSATISISYKIMNNTA